MENLEHDPRAIALGSTMTEDLQGIKKLLTNLKAGSGPRVQDLGSYSRFYKLVLARCAWFVKAVARLGPADGKTAKVFKGKVIRGLPALEHIAETLRQRVAQKDPSLEQADAKDLNTFAWLLSPTQRETNKEIQAGIANIVHARGGPHEGARERRGREVQRLGDRSGEEEFFAHREDAEFVEHRRLSRAEQQRQRQEDWVGDPQRRASPIVFEARPRRTLGPCLAHVVVVRIRLLRWG